MPLDNHLVSVIVPVFNGEKYLSQALASILAQNYPRIEVIIVDDGSTDNTAQIIAQYEKIQYIRQTNQGVASARNKGIAASGGEIIAFLDSDDFWPPEWLTLAVSYLYQHPEVGYVLGKQLLFVEPGCILPSWARPEWLKEPQYASSTAVLTVRKEIFAGIGTFNEDYQSGEDTEWLVRASEAGIRMARLPDLVLYRRIHDNNLSTQTIAASRANLIRIARESIRRLQVKNKTST